MTTLRSIWGYAKDAWPAIVVLGGAIVCVVAYYVWQHRQDEREEE